MELIKGKYKKTELGYIPNDWIFCEFKDVLNGFASGQTPYRAIPRYYSGNIPWITSGELNYRIIYDTYEKITHEAVINTNLKIIPKGTFLFAITGLEAEGTRGRCAITGIESTTNQSCMALYPKENKITTNYLYHFYLKYGEWLAFKYCQGTKQQSFTGEIVKKLPIILPPSIKEQEKIARTLSDIDELISGLEKLIAKKRNIKQGAMQKFLKPKKGWEKKKIVDNFQLLAGKSKSNFIEEGGDYIIMDMGSVSTQGEIIYNKRTNRKADLLNWGDLVMPKDDIGGGNIIGKVAFINENNKYVLGDHVFKLKPINNNIDSLFFSFLINSQYVNKYLKHKVSGSAQLGLGRSSVEEQEIFHPKEKNEQMRISNIIEDMNIELRRLEINLLKYKMLKQGMMQNLLTGKTRLI